MFSSLGTSKQAPKDIETGIKDIETGRSYVGKFLPKVELSSRGCCKRLCSFREDAHVKSLEPHTWTMNVRNPKDGDENERTVVTKANLVRPSSH